MTLYRKSIALFLVLFLQNLMIAQESRKVDFSEKVIQVKKNVRFQFDPKGFGIYDWSDNSIKFFNWNLELCHSIPITIGEGPAEIKPYIYTACLAKNSIFLIGYLDTKINEYNLEGKFIKSIPIDFSPMLIKYHRDKIYLFNSSFSGKDEPTLLVKIIDPVTGKQYKDIFFKKKISVPKEYEEIADNIRGSILKFDIDDNIYLLNTSRNIIYEFDEEGKIISEIKLPYRFDISYSVNQDGTDTFIKLNMRELYFDFKSIEKIIYACYMKTEKEEKEKDGILEKTWLVKLQKDGSYSHKEFYGYSKILGEHNGILYLFNFTDYHVITIKLSDWK